ncbi:MAG: chromosome partitioning protein ParB, partial [Bergeyella zoohelcum]|nr:chromosome partitioning protein ParB [Bergeyella zoohelcum]
TQENLSHRVGKERSTITNSLRLLKLNPSMQNAIRSGEISAGHGRAILSLESEELQQLLFEQIIKQGLSVRQTEAVANTLKKPNEKPEKKPKNIPNELKRAEKRLTDVLEVKVEIKASANGKKGKIVLDFQNEEELEQILSHFQ